MVFNIAEGLLNRRGSFRIASQHSYYWIRVSLNYELWCFTEYSGSFIGILFPFLYFSTVQIEIFFSSSLALRLTYLFFKCVCSKYTR